MKEKLTEKLKKLDFIEGQNLFNMGDEVENPYIKITLYETKKLFPEVAYIYFRRFPQENRPPLAQAYIFDFSDEITLPESFGETVKNIWLTGKIALIYAFTQTEVKIISGYEQPEYLNNYYHISIIDKIEIAKLAQNKMFSAKKLDNGSFWDENPHQEHFNFKNSPYEILLNKIKQMLEDIAQKDEQLPPQDAKPFYQKLLLRSILVKYLEDRRDETGGVFREGYFSEISGADDTFISVLNKPGAILKLFKKLEDDFNGNIFALSETEKGILRDKDLSPFTDVFDGNVDEIQQIHIWELYSFNYLPIELISNIYEEFMPKVAGVVYTPPFLVDFLIDQSMPLNDLIDNEGDYKVIDPSCGSGVFLVAAFKRLVQAWKLKNPNKNLSIEVLQKILRNSIFGIDIQRESIELAAFSLTIALCDQLSPKKIRNLKFDDLTESNLFEKDFFTVILNEEKRYNELMNSFDLVIGNPPFDSHLTTIDAEKVELKQQLNRGCKLPDNQIALLFLETVPNLCKTNGRTCLIQPAGPSLYNSGSFNFRSYLFKTYDIPIIYDFTPLESTLFGIANVATTAFIIENKTSIEHSIHHIIIRRTSSSKERMFFELDKYDFHKISYNDALKNKLIWKSNLLGGGRLKFISERLQNIRTLDQYLANRIQDSNWIVSEGFIIGNRQEISELKQLKNKTSLSIQDLDRLSELEKKYKKSNFISDKPFIPTFAFNENGIDNRKVIIQKSEYFLRPRDSRIYSPPHLLIKKCITKTTIPIEIRSDYVTFKHRIIGIHAENDQKNELINIESYISNNKSLLGFMALVSSTYMVSRATAFNKDDLFSLPYPNNFDELDLSSFEQILIDDVLDYQIDFRRTGEKAKVMKPAKPKELLAFAVMYLKVLNSVYKEFKAAEPIETNSFICFPFYFGDKPKQNLEEFKNNKQQLEEHLDSLIELQTSSTLRINRILRIYDKNIIYLIKPKQLRYWLRSIAIRDADETVADFIEQGF
ncbi:MAG: N-6 DNA methylase [Candidatus Cloacimonadales bacterium]|nr:N-6 DNA methylase [Candidatus Cloacimonadales bacterium]